MQDTWFKLSEAAKYSGNVSCKTARKWLRQGLKHARLPSGRVLISKQQIDEWLHTLSEQVRQCK